MSFTATYGHTNLIARDWRTLAAFYERLFGCVPVPPVRDLEGDALERGTGVPDARLQGVHLRLPGCGDTGPTLEIFTYSTSAERSPAAADRPGFGHIAFGVSDVAAARDEVLAAGGSGHGDIVSTQAGARTVTWAYVRDPEGNLIELQSWSSGRRADQRHSATREEHDMSDPGSLVSDAFRAFTQEAPDHAQAWGVMAGGLAAASALDENTAALAYLAVLAAQRLESGIPFHVQTAKRAGASRQEVVSSVLIGLPAAGLGVTQVLPAAIAAYEASE